MIAPRCGLANANSQLAASFGHVEVCQLLIANGADVLTTDWRNR